MKNELSQRNFDEPAIVAANEPHMALVFVLDCSSSMMGTPIDNLNKGFNRFLTEVCKNPRTKEILDVAVVGFNHNISFVKDFAPVEYVEEIKLVATGGTTMTPPIKEALKMVDERSRFYCRTSTEPYMPWILLISDGAPSDDISVIAQEIKAMEDAEKVKFISLGVEGYNPKVLHDLSGPKVLKLEGHDFTDFFDWVNKSMRAVSATAPGENPESVDTTGNVVVDRSTDWDKKTA
jgi:uncharacterized protein YegL